MRILHIDESFHPNFGYQPCVLTKFQARQGNDVYVITTQKDKIHPVFSFGNDDTDLLVRDREWEKSCGGHILRASIKGYVARRAQFKKGIYRMIDEINPDVVMCHMVECLMSIDYILRGKYKKYPTVFDSHMLRMSSQSKFAKVYNFIYRNTVSKIINRYDLKVIRAQDDDYINGVLGIKSGNTPFISFGTDTMLFSPNEEERKNFRKNNSISDDAFVVIYTGKLDEPKGGKFLAETLKRRFDIPDHEVIFVVVGNSVGEYGKEVDKILEASENRIIRFPTQRYPELGRFYQSADLCLFARQCSLSFFDAQACGLPVVFEDNNINVDRSKFGNAFTFEAGNVDSFRSTIKKCIAMDNQEYAKMKQNSVDYIRNNYDYNDIAHAYTDVLKKEYDKFHAKELKNDIKN